MSHLPKTNTEFSAVQPLPAHIRIIAGPNGAGKTTFAKQYLPQEAGCLHFINADLIAAGLSPFAPERAAITAGKLMLTEMDRLIAAGQSFAFETTLSGRSYARAIPQWRAKGYLVSLIFLGLPTVDYAIQRVHERVLEGGHAIPEAVIRRRYRAGRSNFETVYKPLVQNWYLFDNSQAVPVLLQEGNNDV